eukprot:TRINITY_DN1300_c0_g3_i1.p1 TRINITY_DN1300_c0_g3~~TRINITY_DN1300_c0_g3_i1.p1  ORF type:complete len:297 (+),score=66.19 TRINITY_DN1300_c0_g3_i1:74-964(+)
MSDFVLIVSPDVYKMPTVEPYCLAAEAALRMGHVEFTKEVEVTDRAVPRLKGERNVWSAREGFENVLDNVVLVTRSPFAKEEAKLTEEQKVVKKAFATLCENELTPVVEWILAGDDAALTRTLTEYRKKFSAFRRYILPNSESRLQAMHANIKNSNLDGDEVIKILDKVCSALADQLGNSTWMLGTTAPTVLDAIVFGFIGCLLYPAGTASRRCAQHLISSYPSLVAYMEATRQRFFEVYSLSFFLRRSETDQTEPAPPPSGSLCSSTCCLATTASIAYFLTLQFDQIQNILRDLE